MGYASAAIAAGMMQIGLLLLWLVLVDVDPAQNSCTDSMLVSIIGFCIQRSDFPTSDFLH